MQLDTKVNYIDDNRQGIYKSYYENGCELSIDANLKSSLDDFLSEKKEINVFYSDNSKRENLSSTNSLGQLSEEVNYIDGVAVS